MATLYHQLKHERESRGLRRVDVARATSVYIHQLAALEYANFDELPQDAADLESCVRAYADYLGLDADAIAAEFLEGREVRPPKPEEDETGREEAERLEVVVETALSAPALPEQAPGPTPEMSARLSQRRSPAAAVVIAGGSLLIFALVWLGLQWSSDSAREVPASPPVTARTPRNDPDRPPAQTATPLPEMTREEPPVQNRESDLVAETQQIAEPAPSVEPERPAPVVTGRALTVAEQGVGTRVVRLRLQGESDTFTVGQQVWYWTRIDGGSRGRKIRHVWKQEGRVTDRVDLKVNSASWRTYSRKKLYSGAVGRWTVETHDENGNVLANRDFTVTE